MQHLNTLSHVNVTSEIMIKSRTSQLNKIIIKLIIIIIFIFFSALACFLIKLFNKPGIVHYRYCWLCNKLLMLLYFKFKKKEHSPLLFSQTQIIIQHCLITHSHNQQLLRENKLPHNNQMLWIQTVTFRPLDWLLLLVSSHFFFLMN